MEYQIELKSIYESIHSGGLVNSMLGFSVFVGVLYIARRIYTVWRDYNGEKDKDAKLLFDLVREYAIITLIIIAMPVVLTNIEMLLAGVQESVSKQFNASVEYTVTEAIVAEVEKYQTEEVKTQSIGEKTRAIIEKTSPLFSLRALSGSLLGSGINLFLIGITKYIYFFFCAGRYLWLLMLEIIAPFAIISFLDDDKRNSIFWPWLKNMTICYLLVPFFLLADVFAELSIKALAANSLLFSYNQNGILATIGILVLKLALYKIAAQRAFNLIN